MNITIVGAGMMGSAMSRPALDNGHQVTLVGTPLDREIITELKKTGYHKTLKRRLEGDIAFLQFEEAESCIREADFVIAGVSSFGVEWFKENVLPLIPQNGRVLAITKGLKKTGDGKLIPFPRYYASCREDVSFNAVGGPCISFELADRIETQVAFCGQDLDILRELREALATDYYSITVTRDIEGIETAVALKNAYAMAVSLAIGRYAGEKEEKPEKYNAQAGLFTEAVREMRALIAWMGGEPEAIDFGAGDLYVTVFGGRTRRLGTLLGAGLTFEQAREVLAGVTLESVATIRLFGEVLDEKIRKYPLMAHIHELITENQVKEADWKSFRGREEKKMWKVPKGVIIAGHRGDPKHYPENTMLSFASALHMGADMIETDIHMTKDGKLVLMHDHDTLRTTDVPGLVREKTFEEIRRLNAGTAKNPQTVPTLEELLNLCKENPEILLDLEIKVYLEDEGEERVAETIEKTVKAIEEYGYEGRIMVNCFDAYVLEEINRKWPGRFILHGYYPYSIMHHVKKDPAEYLDFACYWADGEEAKKQCAFLDSQNILTCTGSNTPKERFFAACKLGVKMFTENDPASALAWRNSL